MISPIRMLQTIITTMPTMTITPPTVIPPLPRSECHVRLLQVRTRRSALSGLRLLSGSAVSGGWR